MKSPKKKRVGGHRSWEALARHLKLKHDEFNFHPNVVDLRGLEQLHLEAHKRIHARESGQYSG